ncbi:MAG: glycosyltransferase family 4 protein [Anaerolineae bacterium]|nr:glycosyltransferase family 4 protein [Anaerolineae bacterium]
MRICYTLISPTFEMHQYTADLANRMSQAGHDVHLVTSSHAPLDRYIPAVTIHTPVDTVSTGSLLEGLKLAGQRKAAKTIFDIDPDLIHFSGPHIWNLSLMRKLKARGLPVIHTLHTIDPPWGSNYGAVVHLWNRQIIRAADYILVHGQTFLQRLLDMGLPRERVTSTPLLHLFVGGSWLGGSTDLAASVEYQPWALFFGRLRPYKGVEYLISACAMMKTDKSFPGRVIIAGFGDLSQFWGGSLPARLEIHNRRINDEEAMDLFCRCGLVVLPYIDASQSALIAAAYYFRKPVIVTRTGALPEYVREGETGFIVEPDHPAALARCLERVLDDPVRLERMGAAGRAWYEVHRMEQEAALIQVYTRLAEAKAVALSSGTARKR